MSAVVAVPVELPATYLEDYEKIMKLCSMLTAEVNQLKQVIATNAVNLPRFAQIVHDDTLFAIDHVKTLSELIKRY